MEVALLELLSFDRARVKGGFSKQDEVSVRPGWDGKRDVRSPSAMHRCKQDLREYR